MHHLPRSTLRCCSLLITPAHQTSLPWITGNPGPLELVDALNFTFPLEAISDVQDSGDRNKRKMESGQKT